MVLPVEGGSVSRLLGGPRDSLTLEEDALAAKDRARRVRQRHLLDRTFGDQEVVPTEAQMMALAVIDYRINFLHESRQSGDFNPTETLNDITDNMLFLAINRASKSYPNSIEVFDQDFNLLNMDSEYKSCAIWRMIYCLNVSTEAQSEFVRLCSIVSELLQRCLYEIQWRMFLACVSDLIRSSSTIH